MSEYWKSTPKYWCKQCGIYVRDTKLDRANHESTGKHKSALQRSLRDLHRGHEREEREKDRAKREVERLNGVVSGKPSTSYTQAHGGPREGAYGGVAPPRAGAAQPAEVDRQQQLEQLAELGVNIPTELRRGMAMAGEWTVTSTRVVKEPGEGKESASVGTRATGVRKRERELTEEQKEEEKAIKGLFKKPRNWGRDMRDMPSEGDAELDQLLSGPLVKAKKEEGEGKPDEKADGIKSEDDHKPPAPSTAVESEPSTKEAPPLIKRESDGGDAEVGQPAPAEEGKGIPAAPDSKSNDLEPAEAEPTVVFKKRKPKNIRQK